MAGTPERATEGPTDRELKARLGLLSERLDAELGAVKNRLDTVSYAAERGFNIILVLGAIFGGVASLLGSAFVFITWKRDQQHHASYLAERAFLENRLTVHDTFQQWSQVQQFDLGETLRGRSGKMLDEQIENISKLGGVIKLVEDTFRAQKEREAASGEQAKELAELRAAMNVLNESYRQQYIAILEQALGFQHHSRMAWTHLSPEEYATISRVRAAFESLPAHIIAEERKRDPLAQARTLQLLGVSAYYGNDIASAEKHLKTAGETFDFLPPQIQSQNRKPHAFCSHFLGLVEKNWCLKERTILENLEQAKVYLEKAAELQRGYPAEFLTPLTLLEVRTSLPHDIADTAPRLELLIKALRTLQEKEEIDANQRMLLGRALLLRGNVAHSTGDRPGAVKWYREAIEQSPGNAYALLSAGSATGETTNEGRDLLRRGLDSLESSGALRKAERTGRVSALVWAIASSHWLGDATKKVQYDRQLAKEAEDVRVVAGRVPLFFCPIAKKQTTFEELKRSLDEATRKVETVALQA